MRYIRTHHDAGHDRLGGKAEALAALHGAGLPIPAWFVVGSAAFTGDFVLSSAAQAEIAEALRDLLGSPDYVAVRSSAPDEDGAHHSFAGQLKSFLFVRPEDVADRVADVWRSAFSGAALAYRAAHDLPPPQPPAILVQRMVDADRAGVVFSADPTSGRRTVAVVSAVAGLGSALVDGVAEADTYHVDRMGGIAERHVARQVTAHRFHPVEGVQAVVVPPPARDEAVLNDEEVKTVAVLARHLERRFGRPQDVEWAFEGGQLWLLQSRPITTLAGLPDPDAAPTLWDNSNIAESYSGVTTPLTFSFAQRAYQAVYLTFCRQMGVDEATLEDHAGTFRSMIGLIRGRIYYNLVSWYRTLALLPGYRTNRSFMEAMMGVRETLPADLIPSPEPPSRRARLRDGLRLARSATRLLFTLARLPRQIEAFYRRIDTALDEPEPGLEALRLDELAAIYRRLEAQLLTRWDAPIANDFFAMIFFGLSKKLVAAWASNDTGSLHSDLLSDQGGIVSTEPARLLREMADLARADADLTHVLSTGTLDAVQGALSTCPPLNTLVQDYLDRFSDRCLDELKLESPTLRADPLVLYRAIGALAARPPAAPAPPSDLRQNAEERLRQALRRRPLRRLVLRLILKQARARVVSRENLRFERTRVFGLARRLFTEMGRRLCAEGQLDAADDVFFLETEEILGFVEGTATTSGLRSLAQLRRAEFERYRAETPPPDRFLARGAVHGLSRFEPSTSPIGHPPEGTVRQGLGCGPGLVRGKVRVVRHPREAVLEPGEVLVAERTDPGWVLLFASCSGLVVERGSLLSHAAIVAREMRLPAVVSLPGATTWLQDGDLVEVDGATGQVRRLQPLPLCSSRVASHVG